MKKYKWLVFALCSVLQMSALTGCQKETKESEVTKEESSIEIKDEETQVEEMQTKETQVKEMQTKETQVEEMQTEETQVEEMQTEETQIEEMQTEETQVEETIGESDVENGEVQNSESGIKEDQAWHFGTVKRNPVTENMGIFAKNIWMEQFVYIFSQEKDGVELLPLKDTRVAEKIQSQMMEMYDYLEELKPGFTGSGIYERKCEISKKEIWANTNLVFNNLLSVYYQKMYFYQMTSDDAGLYFNENFYQMYNLKTGELMELKDLFYEDTDYVSLLNEMIAEWEVKQGNYGEVKPFGGIKEDQGFYIDRFGNFCIDIPEYDRVFQMDAVTFANISAVYDAVGTEKLLDVEANWNLCVQQHDKVTVEKEIIPNYHDLNCTDETVLYIKKTDVPAQVLESIKNNEILNADPMEDDNVVLLCEKLEGANYTLKKSYTIEKIGPLYGVAVKQEFEYEDITDEIWERVRDVWYQFCYAPGQEAVFFDEKGDVITYRDLFRADVDIEAVMTEGILNSWMKYSQEDWDRFYGLPRTEEGARDFLRNADITITDMGIWAYDKVIEVFADITWECVLPYLK